jgi:hypothetical protein
VILKNMDVPTSDLQDFFEIQMQLNNEKIKINLKIRNYFNKIVTKHEHLYTKQLISFSFFDQIEFFCSIGNVKWKATKFILTKKK